MRHSFWPAACAWCAASLPPTAIGRPRPPPAICCARSVSGDAKARAWSIASAPLGQHLGGAWTERLATSAADALYAAYRMARLGIIVMDLCRPIPFRENEVPSVTSLVGNVLRRRSDALVPSN